MTLRRPDMRTTVIPQEFAALTRKAQAYVDAGQLGDAELLLTEIIRLNPREHYAWGLLARLALEQGQSDIAQERVQRALELDRRNADYLNVLAVAQAEAGDMERAESTLRRALRERPTHADAHFNLGKVLEKRGDHSGARREYERALSLDPKHQGALGNLARALAVRGDPEGAMRVLQGAVADGSADPWNVTIYGAAVEATNGLDAAIAFYADACRRLPTSGFLRRAHAHARLIAGDYGHGWQEFLGRNLTGSGAFASIPGPLPQRLDGRAIRLLPEMGLGDILFFLRFAPELVARGATVSITAPDKLATLLARTGFFASVVRQSEVSPIEEGDTLSVADLPGILQSDAPVPAFRLVPDPALEAGLRARLAALGPPPYMGVTWRAGSDFRRGPEFGRDRGLLFKGIAPDILAGALRDAPGTLVSTQRQPVADELSAFSGALGRPLHDLSALNEDLDSMLCLLAVLDEYVGVSNTNTHLRAGLGRTSRVLVPFPPEWRWMGEGDESPWFPGCRVYRQTPDRSWTNALDMLQADLLSGASRDADRRTQQENG
jgi:Flp pilus assembly protein TadD